MGNKLFATALVATVSLLGVSTVTFASSSLPSQGTVAFTPSNGVTPPYNPNHPNHPVGPVDPKQPEPGTAGPLSLDFASNFDFGTHKIQNADASYAAKAQKVNDGGTQQEVPDYVQVPDDRGTHAGWSLRVAQNGQFKSDDAKRAKVLTGATVTLSGSHAIGRMVTPAPQTRDETLPPAGDQTVVMNATKGEGAGTWLMPWGADDILKSENQVLANNQPTAVLTDPDVILNVPESTPREAVAYTTTLTWTLNNVPM